MIRRADHEIVLIRVLDVEALDVVRVRLCSGVYCALTLDALRSFLSISRDWGLEHF